MEGKPLEVLGSSLSNRVIVVLKGNREYRGTLEGYDPHMNIILRNAEEYLEGNLLRKTDLTIVRGDNIIYISP
jgi:small nuclear ribonucleoprotein